MGLIRQVLPGQLAGIECNFTPTGARSIAGCRVSRHIDAAQAVLTKSAIGVWCANGICRKTGLHPVGVGTDGNQTVETVGRAIQIMKKKLFDQLKQSLREAEQIRRGTIKPLRVFKFDPQNDIVKVRSKLGLSQSKFAAVLGISADTLQNWEQGRRSPTGPAK